MLVRFAVNDAQRRSRDRLPPEHHQVVPDADKSPATPGSVLSIVVPCVDEHALLDRFLRSVCELLPGTEVVVIDMGRWTPPPEVRQHVALRAVPAKLASIAAAKNLGLRYATRSYVALMDSDNVLLGDAEEWRTALASGFATGADLITLGRREEARRLATGVTPTKWNFSRYTIGWSVIWRREHLLRLGGFDERFGTSTLAGCGEDFRPLYEHFADPRTTTTSRPRLEVGHPSLQKPVSMARLYRYTYGSAISTLLPLRHGLSPMAAFWTAKTVAGFAADLVRGIRHADRSWLAVVLRARARAIADAAILGVPRRLPEPARRTHS